MGRIRVHRRTRGAVAAGTERAATLVEYALLVAVLVIPTGMGLSYLQSGARSKIGGVAEGVAQPPAPMDDDDGSDPSAGGGGGGGGPSTTASSTSTPTTTPPSTTTTAKATTTTAKATTTTSPPKPVPASNERASASADQTGKSSWSATAETTVLTEDGDPVPNAKVTLEICTRKGSGKKWTCSSYQVTTDADGVASKTVTGYTNKDTAMRATVTAVIADGFDLTLNSTPSTSDSPFCSSKC